MFVRAFTCLAAAAFAASLAACGSDDGSSKPAQSSTATTPGGSSSSESSSSESSSSESSSSSSESSTSSSGGGGTTAFGKDCTESAQCADGKCVRFTDNDGNPRGFCSRVCTKAEDCPEEGWECNLAPYTACVPAKN